LRIPKTWVTIALLLACAAAPWLVPGYDGWRLTGPLALPEILSGPWRGNPLARVFRVPEPERAQKAVAADNAAPPAVAPPLPPLPAAGRTFGGDWPAAAEEDGYATAAAGAVGIEDYGGVMAAFYDRLARTERKAQGAVTRISHFGDSPVTGDLISGDARARLQARFGDAGHGFIFVGRPWEWYNHRGVRLTGGGWSIQSPMLQGVGKAGAFGLGGASFTGWGTGARSRIGTAARGRGASVGRFDIHFQSAVRGGTLLASVDGQPPVEIPTGAAEGEGGLVVHTIPVADGGHELSLRPKGDGAVRLFGVVLERDVPGVVYDTLGANGATVRHVARFDRGNWIDSLRQRRPDLVVLNYGTNESRYTGLSFSAYARDYREVVRRVREALPECAILVMAPMDRGERSGTGGIATADSIPRMVAAQRLVARSEKVAFFDTYAAMGGPGTMADWYERSPRLVAGDFTHPTHRGAARVGDLLVDALMKGYASRLNTESSRPEGAK
jgi:lysophospholipase L1-like esterase